MARAVARFEQSPASERIAPAKVPAASAVTLKLDIRSPPDDSSAIQPLLTLSGLIGRLPAHGSEARHAVRLMAACLLAFILYALFDLPQGYWAVFSVLIVMQASIGGTVNASIDRMIGTVLGAAIGGVAAWARPQTMVGLGVALTLCAGATGFIAAVRPNLRVAPVTAAIMLLSSAGKLGPLQAALYRVVEIGLGSGIGVLATLLIFPARANAVVAERVRASLGLIAELLTRFTERLQRGWADAAADDLAPLHDRLRATLAGVESAMADADRERSSRLGEHRFTPSVRRTLWRVRTDALAVGRALAAPWPAELREPLAPAASAMLEAAIAFARACDAALQAQRPVERRDFESAHTAFQRGIERFRGLHLTRDLTFDAVGGAFGLAFALESLFGDLTDLADRLDETVAAPRGAPSRDVPESERGGP